MIYVVLALIYLLLFNNCEIIADDQSDDFSMDTSKFNIPSYIGFGNNSDFLLKQENYFVDDNFQITPLNDYGNINFNLIKFDGIVLNNLYDKSFDNSILFDDKNINYHNNFNNFGDHFNNNIWTSLRLLGGSNIGNANLFIQGKIGKIDIQTRNNYYVSNGFNNPKGVIFNPISEISKQSFQSSLSLFLQDSKSLIAYNQLIVSNTSNNNFDDVDNFFKDCSNFNSIFSLKYLSISSEFIRSNGQLFLKYSNSKSRNSNLMNLIRSNELSYGLNLGFDLHFNWFQMPTKINFQLSEQNSELTLIEKFYQIKVEKFDFSINQELNLYDNNITQIALSYNLANPIDDLTRIDYSKISRLGLEFNYHHYINSRNNYLNDNYISINLSNELPSFKYLFAKSIINDSSTTDFNYQDIIKFGSKTMVEFLNLTMDFNISYIRFNEFYYEDSISIGSNLNESWIFNLDFSFKYWILMLELKNSINLLGKEFRTDYRINNLPEMMVNLKLDFNLSTKTVISLLLKNYKFNYKNNLNEGFKGFSENTNLINLKIEQNISDKINLFLSINNILDEQVPLFPNYYASGFNYLGGIVIIF